MKCAALSELSDGMAVAAGSDYVPPKYTQLLKDIECPEGQMVKFECRVIGHPPPEVKWFKGRQQIFASTDFLISAEKELHVLTIPEAFKEDTGNYVVRAKNIAGEAKCYATLSVKTVGDKHVVKTRVVEASHTVPTSTIPGHKPPEFQKLFHDLRAKLGKPCHFEVIVTGTPRPSVIYEYLYVSLVMNFLETLGKLGKLLNNVVFSSVGSLVFQQ